MSDGSAERGLDTRLAIYTGRHPSIHLLDVASGTTRPLPSAADRYGIVFGRFTRRDGFVTAAANGLNFAMPPDLGEPWVQLPGRWEPVPSQEPSRLWLCTDSGRAAVLVSGDGVIHRQVPLPRALMLRAEVAGGLLGETDDGTACLVGFDGSERPAGVWGGFAVSGAYPDAVVGFLTSERHRLLLRDRHGADLGAAGLGASWAWNRFGDLSSTAGLIAATAREVVAEGARRRLVHHIADLRTGVTSQLGDGWITATCWSADGTQLFVSTPDEIATCTPGAPTLRRVAGALGNPLIELPGASEISLPSDVQAAASVALQRPSASPGPDDEVADDEVADDEVAAGAPLPGPLSARLVVDYRRADDVRVNHAGRLGGDGLVASGAAWPREAESGRPLAFIGAVDLARARDALGENPLPERGWLTLWVDAALLREWGEASGLVAVHADPVGQILPPDDLPADHRFLGHPMAVVSELCRPRHEMDSGRQHPLHYHPSTGLAPYHRLLGYPDWNQTDSPDPEWVLLAQVDNDSGVGFDWGDARLCVWIEPADLLRGDFSNCRFVQHAL